MEDFNITELLIGIISGAVGVLATFLAAQWGAFKERAAQTPNQIDDQVVRLVEQVANRIVAAKLEDPAQPLGTPPTPRGGPVQ